MPVSSANFVNLLIRLRWALLALAAVLAALAWRGSQQLTFDRSLENMFAEESPLLEPYRKLKRVFGGNELVMAVYEDKDLLASDGSGIRRLKKVRKRLEEAPGVKAVLSLDQLDLISDSEEDVVSPAGEPIRELFEGYTHSDDGKVAALVCMLTPAAEAGVPRRETINQLRDAMAPLPRGMITGEPVLISDGFDYVERDGERLGWWTTLLLGATLAICFRSLRWVVIPIAVVQWTFMTTTATLAVSGLELSMVSSMLRAIVTVVAVAAVMHLVVRYRDARRGEGEAAQESAVPLPPRRALCQAGALVAAPIFWAEVTDAAGFSSLLAAEAGPVQDFGLMMALGALFTLPAAALLIPGLALWGRGGEDGESRGTRSWSRVTFDVVAFVALTHFYVEAAAGSLEFDLGVLSRALSLFVLLALGVVAVAFGWTSDPQPLWKESAVFRPLRWPLHWAVRHPVALASMAILSTAALSYGVLFLKIETDFTKNFRANTPIVQAYAFVESRLGGAGVWDVILPAPDELDMQYINKIRRLQERLRDEVMSSEDESAGLTKVLSLADIAGTKIGPVKIDQLPSMFQNAALNVALGRVQQRLPEFYDALYSEDPDSPGQHYFRIMLRAKERQGAREKRELIEHVRRISHEEFADAEVTGFFVLLANLIDSLIRDQWRTFGLAAAAIWLIMALALRSVLLATFALIPNAMPILCVMGLLGWLGLKLNMGAAMIAAVSIGLSIDGSIHYLASFQRARRRGMTVSQALGSVQEGTGRPLIFATVALIVGFSVLWTSDFVPTIYFGALVSLAMLGGLLGNLVVLPMLLSLTCFHHEPIQR